MPVRPLAFHFSGIINGLHLKRGSRLLVEVGQIENLHIFEISPLNVNINVTHIQALGWRRLDGRDKGIDRHGRVYVGQGGRGDHRRLRLIGLFFRLVGWRQGRDDDFYHGGIVLHQSAFGGAS